MPTDPKPVYVAKLVSNRRPGPNRRPRLFARFWCPRSRKHIEIPAPDDMVPGMKFPGTDGWGASVEVQLDPDEAVRDRLALSYFQERLAAWRREQALAWRPVPLAGAEGRSPSP